MTRLVAIFLVFLGATAAVTAEEETAQADRWDFEVYVDDKRIGSHFFEVAENGSLQQSINTAEFKYRILLIPAWSFSHTNTEQWNDDGCLESFEATTRINGRTTDVSGTRTNGSFVVETGDVTTRLPSCIMSFAYWDTRFLEQPQLINPQSGDYLPVTVERLPAESLEIRGTEVVAQPYRVRAEQLELKLWYSEDDEWLALESAGKNGRTIRYELT